MLSINNNNQFYKYIVLTIILYFSMCKILNAGLYNCFTALT